MWLVEALVKAVEAIEAAKTQSCIIKSLKMKQSLAAVFLTNFKHLMLTFEC